MLLSDGRARTGLASRIIWEVSDKMSWSDCKAVRVFLWVLSTAWLATTQADVRGGSAPPAGAAVRVTASSSAPGHTPEMAFDDNLSTRWVSGLFHGEPEWIQIDLGKSLPVRTVILHWEAAYAESYQIQVSDNERTWRALREVRDSLGGQQTCGSLGGQGRYVRVFCLKPGRSKSVSLWELELPDKELTGWLNPAKQKYSGLPTKLTPKPLLPQLAAGGVQEIVFALRPQGGDSHWYATFGHYADSDQHVAYTKGGKLCRLELASHQLKILLDDPQGGIRDPIVYYDAQKILFSYRRGGSPYFHLYEISADGSNLRQLTDGPYDDIEPCYLPDDRIAFISSRANRYVNCWITQVATLHRCNADGSHIERISANIEQDNTPWSLPDGRILYTRWEYVDRANIGYHHLWTINPDGTGQMVYFGNLYSSDVMIDAKPIPGSTRIVAIFSPVHGRPDHNGVVTIVDVSNGPDDREHAQPLTTRNAEYRDPWAFSEDLFMAAERQRIVLMDAHGHCDEIFHTSKEDEVERLQCHEPRPLVPRPREQVLPDRTTQLGATGTLVLENVYEGRNMEGVKPGEIKKLLIFETLPKPINFGGTFDVISYGGTFTLVRVLGTVPVEPDGSAMMEVPVSRPVFFVALDEHDLAVKRMLSFTSVQPGEVTGCIGCHEHRTTGYQAHLLPLAASRKPSRIEPIPDCPEVFDFPRDIQPLLNRLCADCHSYEKTSRGGPYAGHVILTGDHGPTMSHAYYTMTVRRLFSDNRNQARADVPPHALGSSASRVLKMLDGSHYGARATEKELRLLRVWIDAGAPYPGTYAALGSGCIGGEVLFQTKDPNIDGKVRINADQDWPTTKAGSAVIAQRCANCHQGKDNTALPRALADERPVHLWWMNTDDPQILMSRHIVFNLTQPAHSLLLLAPLAKAAGGFELCRAKNGHRVPVFTNTADPDYRTLLAMVTAGKKNLDSIKRFDIAGFRPLPEYLREMKRYGVLPPGHRDADAVDPYDLDRRYWESQWYHGNSP